MMDVLVLERDSKQLNFWLIFLLPHLNDGRVFEIFRVAVFPIKQKKQRNNARVLPLWPYTNPRSPLGMPSSLGGIT